MKSIGHVILALIALLTGGCSLFFLATLGEDSFPLSAIGLVVAAICMFAILMLPRNDPPDRPSETQE